MRVRELKLQHVRNYRELCLAPDAGLCVLTGDNASGKTNVLEAIFLCALGRSHRTARDAELVEKPHTEGRVELTLGTLGGTRRIRADLLLKERKRLYLDDAPLSRSGELMGCLNVVMFSPEDLALVKDGPGERRRFLDMELSQLKPAYYYTLQQYNQALKQRNILLKNPDCVYDDMLELWDEQLARLGASIILSRAAFVEELQVSARALHASMSGMTEDLIVSYQPNVPPAEKEQLFRAIRAELAENIEKDIFRGSTSTGPHRDDVLLLLDGLDVRIYGSQGQQRTAALSLKLSEVELMYRIRGEYPVLLLDDVFSELDNGRQARLLGAVEQCQTFVTCTHLEELTRAGADRMQVYHVADGHVVEV